MSIDYFKRALCRAAAFLCVSCSLPVPIPAPVVQEGGEQAQEAGECTLHLDIVPEKEDTKSALYTDESFNRLHDVTVYGIDETGFWRRAFLSPVQSASAGITLNFPAGRQVRIFALANMGDIAVPSGSDGKPDFAGFVYTLSPSANLVQTGFPMAGSVTVRAHEGQNSISLGLKRLFAKVQVNIDKNGLTGHTVAPVLLSDQIILQQANRRLCPFANDGSKALSQDDLFPQPLDYHSFGLSEKAGMEHGSLALYVPENLVPDGDALATYLEYSGEKVGTQDGVAGNLVYRGSLGGVQRNTFYQASFSLTWNGLMWQADGWRIDGRDLSDLRRLVLSESPACEDAVAGLSLGNVRRSVGKSLYVNFSRDGGASWVTGGKDLDSWPFGWDLYIDGVRQDGAAGESALHIGWSFSQADGNRLTVAPTSSATAGTQHTLQVRSADGKVRSDEVTFRVSVPLELGWSQKGAPTYVAQRGMLLPFDVEDSSAPVTYSVTSGSECVRLGAAANGQRQMVSFLAPGTVVIHAECEATGQDDDFQFTVTAPLLRQAWYTGAPYYCNPDGSDAASGTDGISGHPLEPYYMRDDGITALSPVTTAATAVAVGNNLAADLYDELLYITPTVDSPLLSFSGDGRRSLHVYATCLESGDVSFPETQGASLGTLTLSARSSAAGVTPFTQALAAANPFSQFGSTPAVNTSKDIQDYSVIGNLFNAPVVTYTAPCAQVYAATGRKGVEASLNEEDPSAELNALFSGGPGGNVSWSSVITARTQRTAGYFTLYAYVQNGHSLEKRRKAFYQGRLFLHGAVQGKAVMQSADVRRMYVHVDYVGAASDYRTDGLGVAFPDISTRHTSRQYSISWSDYESHMYGYDGQCTVEVVAGDRQVQNAGDLLFTVYDDCWYRHYYLDTFTCHEDFFAGTGNDSGPRIYFCTRAAAKAKYTYISRISEDLIYLHPAGAPTFAYNGSYPSCGFFVLHTYQNIEDRWL